MVLEVLSSLKVRVSQPYEMDSSTSTPPRGCTQDVCFEECLKDPPASVWIVSRTRRILEISIALLVLLLAAVPMLIIAACIRLTSHGDVIFSQERIGRQGRRFRIYKFRSMTVTGGQSGDVGLTQHGDMRVTSFGRFLRKLKLDELPQFYNILRGDMSLIGPRPKLRQYTTMFNMPYRPGISGAATIVFRHEEDILRNVPAPHLNLFYKEHIQPVKLRLDVCYMCKATPAADMRMLAETALSCMKRNRTSAVREPVQPL